MRRWKTDDLEALVAHMTANGYAFRKSIRNESKFRHVMVAGLDNLLVELFESPEPGRWQISW